MSEGVEWALHSCLNLTWLESDSAVTAARLAAFYGLPPAYLNKQLQALTRAGILSSVSGPRGGFRLARRPEQISVLDVVVAIEGTEDVFRCQQLLRHGPGGQAGVDYRLVCEISRAMRRAELAWRQVLAGQSLADLKAAVEQTHPGTPEGTRNWFASLQG